MIILTGKSCIDNTLASVGGQSQSLDGIEAKMRAQRLETKTLNTFLKLETRPDRHEIVQYLGFENWDEYNEKYQHLTRMLKTGKACEELLRICLCTHKILTIENMLDESLFTQNEIEKKIFKKIRKFWNQIEPEYRDEFFEQCMSRAESFKQEFFECYPDFDPDCQIQGDKALLRIYKHKLKMNLVEELQDLVNDFYHELTEEDEGSANVMNYGSFKMEILPALRNYLLSRSRLVVTSVHEDLCTKSLWSARDHILRSCGFKSEA